MYRICATPESRFAGGTGGQEAAFSEQALKLPGNGGPRVDQADVRGDHVLEQWLEEGIVRATQDQRVAAGGQQRFDIALQQLTQSRALEIACFDQLYQPGARLGDHLHIGGEPIK